MLVSVAGGPARSAFQESCYEDAGPVNHDRALIINTPFPEILDNLKRQLFFAETLSLIYYGIRTRN